MRSAVPETNQPLVVLGAWLTLINGGVLLFNLLPAVPLDGGRMAQAILWRITGNRARATMLAGQAGRGARDADRHRWSGADVV